MADSSLKVAPSALVQHLPLRPVDGIDEAIRQQGLLEGCILAAQPRDFALERGAIFRCHLARPTHGALAAQRDFAGLRIEPDKAVGHFVERIAASIGVWCCFVGTDWRAQADGGDGDDESLAEHGHLLTGSGFRNSSGEHPLCVVDMGGRWPRLKASAAPRFGASRRTNCHFRSRENSPYLS